MFHHHSMNRLLMVVSSYWLQTPGVLLSLPAMLWTSVPSILHQLQCPISSMASRWGSSSPARQKLFWLSSLFLRTLMRDWMALLLFLFCQTHPVSSMASDMGSLFQKHPLTLWSRQWTGSRIWAIGCFPVPHLLVLSLLSSFFPSLVKILLFNYMNIHFNYLPLYEG